jgi:hypothetical protein
MCVPSISPAPLTLFPAIESRMPAISIMSQTADVAICCAEWSLPGGNGSVVVGLAALGMVILHSRVRLGEQFAVATRSIRVIRILVPVVNGWYVSVMEKRVLMQRFEMKAPPGWLELVDQWRAQQSGIPPRAEAIRRLVELGLAAAKNLPHEK